MREIKSPNYARRNPRVPLRRLVVNWSKLFRRGAACADVLWGRGGSSKEEGEGWEKGRGVRIDGALRGWEKGINKGIGGWESGEGEGKGRGVHIDGALRGCEMGINKGILGWESE